MRTPNAQYSAMQVAKELEIMCKCIIYWELVFLMSWSYLIAKSLRLVFFSCLVFVVDLVGMRRDPEGGFHYLNMEQFD